MSDKILAFDRDVSLAEMLRAVPRAKLEAALKKTVGDIWRLDDIDGKTLWETETRLDAAAVEVLLHVDIEVVGRLWAPEARRAHAQVAVKWLEMVLTSANRYRMAADLHMETVHADYEALQGKHAALLESEARYRELASQLEQRVKAQVEVIERAQRQLYQSEKMASIGSLAAGMAHEINNPIGFIRSNLSTASIYADKMCRALHAFRDGDANEADAVWRAHDIDFILEDFPGLLAESTTGADRVARIIANLKAYSNIDYVAMDAVDLNDAVHAAIGMIADQLPGTIKLETDLQPLRKITCDLSRMNQALYALLQNARQALGADGGLIRVATSSVGNEIRIAISDDGCGIADEIRSRIFDPFFTTRDVGKGMGLGLTVSHDTVNVYGGRIEVQTAAGKGSTFTICLPSDAATELPDRP
jgi:signal transduction histidine kinase